MPAARRSAKVQVIAILNLIGGFLGLLGSVIGVVSVIMVSKGGFGGGGAGGLDSAEMQRYITANSPGYEAYQFAEVAIGFLFDFMLIASGFGLLWLQKWARTTALTWAGLSIVNKIVVVAYSLLVVLPASNAYLQGALANAPPAQRDAMRMGGMIGGYGGVCGAGLFIAYPIVVLCLLMSKSAKQAFEPAAPDEDDDRGPRDDYDDPRERYDDRERKRQRDDDRFRAGDDRY